FGPPIVGAALEPHQLLRRQVGALLGLVEGRPVLRELVPAVLGRIDADAHRIDGNAARVADAGHDALGGRGSLRRPFGVVAPDAIVDLGEEPATIERDAGAPATAGLDAVAETKLDIGPAVTSGIL